MTASGQTRKMRACPQHVRFTPLSGRMRKVSPDVRVGPSADIGTVQILEPPQLLT